MALLHLRHVRSYIDNHYKSLIDMSDCTKLSADDYAAKLVSRGIALFCLVNESGIDPKVGSKFIVDGFDDNGIDAIYHDQSSEQLIVIQSKFIQSAGGGPDQSEIKKFCDGIRDLIAADMTSFNAKTKALAPMIQMALDNTRTKIKAVIAFTGNQLGEHGARDLEKLSEEVNDPSDYLECQILDLSAIHQALSGILDANQISFDLMLNEWGATEEPLKAFYGQANCLEVVTIFEKFGPKLFNKNIRKFLGENEINEAIKQTIVKTPEQFFFLNNGVTILCESADKTVMGGSDRRSGTFKCTGAQVVNGAQTVGSLSKLLSTHKENLEKARVFVRIISVDSAESPISVEITRATNTQNKVEKKDFASLDLNQERIRREFYLDNIQYQYKAGDPKELAESLTIDEAASALAVASGSLNYTILAKKEIGRLFEDIGAPPYSELFNDKTSAPKIWRHVQICRRLDALLEKHRKSTGDKRSIATHGNRVVQHIAYMIFGKSKTENPGLGLDAFDSETIDRIVESLIKQRQIKYKDALLSRLFYNQTKTKDLVDSVIQELQPPPAALPVS